MQKQQKSLLSYFGVGVPIYRTQIRIRHPSNIIRKNAAFVFVFYVHMCEFSLKKGKVSIYSNVFLLFKNISQKEKVIMKTGHVGSVQNTFL